MAAAPKYSLELNATVTPGGDITLRLRASKDNVPQALDFFLFRDGVQIIAGTTAADGFFTHNESHPPTANSQSFTFEAYLKDAASKETRKVDIPAITAPAQAANDPETITLHRMHDGNGNYRIFIRVLKSRGYGVRSTVDLTFRNNHYTVRTNVRGIAIWDVPVQINPGETEVVTAHVNGIEREPRVRLRRRILMIRPPRFSRAWFGTNNGRSFILMSLAMIFILWAIIIGIGQPLIHQNLFRNHETGLSTQESLHNRIMVDTYGDTITSPALSESLGVGMIEGTPSSGHWHHMIWKIGVALFIFSILYALVSMREEIGEEISIAIERIMERDYVQTGDPWFERMVAWTGAYSVARNQAPTVTTGAPQAPERRGGPWSEFPVHLASDIITEIIPAIARAVF